MTILIALVMAQRVRLPKGFHSIEDVARWADQRNGVQRPPGYYGKEKHERRDRRIASKRHERAKACTGKQRHSNKTEAIAHVASLRRSGGQHLQIYKCAFCHGYHVGHAPGRRRPNP